MQTNFPRLGSAMNAPMQKRFAWSKRNIFLSACSANASWGIWIFFRVQKNLLSEENGMFEPLIVNIKGRNPSLFTLPADFYLPPEFGKQLLSCQLQAIQFFLLADIYIVPLHVGVHTDATEEIEETQIEEQKHW
jgi:hypothetical protein